MHMREIEVYMYFKMLLVQHVTLSVLLVDMAVPHGEFRHSVCGNKINVFLRRKHNCIDFYFVEFNRVCNGKVIYVMSYLPDGL